MATRSFSFPQRIDGRTNKKGGLVVALVLDSAKIRAEIDRDMGKVLQLEADKALAFAIALATRELSEDELRVNRQGKSRRNLAKGKRRYRDSFKVEAELGNRKRIRVSIINTHPAWRIIENGTREHKIRKRGKAGPRNKLLFPGSADGEFWQINGPPWVGAPVVNHPGTPAYKIMGKTATAVRRRQTARLPR